MRINQNDHFLNGEVEVIKNGLQPAEIFLPSRFLLLSSFLFLSFSSFLPSHLIKEEKNDFASKCLGVAS